MERGLILVVDDDFDVRSTIRHGLETLGYETAEAQEGESAIAFVLQHPPLAIVFDFLMPGTDSPEVVARLLELAPATPIIVTTGYANEQRLRAELGEDVAILHKPFRMSELAELIHVVTQHA